MIEEVKMKLNVLLQRYEIAINKKPYKRGVIKINDVKHIKSLKKEIIDLLEIVKLHQMIINCE